jgi:hypothetical protein
MARPRERVRLEDGLKLDLNCLIRDGGAKTGELRHRSISWRRARSRNMISSASIETDLRPGQRGWLTITSGQFEQRIQLCSLARTFGGVQWYFVCPAMACRASVLWMPPGGDRFLSRRAWGRHVAYGSQFATRYDRALTAFQRLRYQLGAPQYVSIFRGVPPRRKWMRSTTYDKIIRQCDRHEATIIGHLEALVDRQNA